MMKGEPGFPPSRLHAFTPARQSASARRRGNDEKIWNEEKMWNDEKNRSRWAQKEQVAGIPFFYLLFSISSTFHFLE